MWVWFKRNKKNFLIVWSVIGGFLITALMFAIVWISRILFPGLSVTVPPTWAVMIIFLAPGFIIWVIRLVKNILRSEHNKYKKLYLEDWLRQHYPDATYKADDYLVPAGCRNEMIYAQHYNLTTEVFSPFSTIRGEDYFSWEPVNEIPFTYSEISAMDIQGSGKSERTYQAFEGGLLATACYKANSEDFKYPLCIYSKHSKFIDHYCEYGRKVITENVNFNDRFACYAENQENFFFVITPQVMEDLLQLEKDFGPFYLCIEPNGAMTFAIPDLDLFAYNRDVNIMRENAKYSINALLAVIKKINNDMNLGTYYRATPNFN